MQMLMDVFITLPGKINSQALYNEVKAFKFNVTDLEVKTFVYGRIDIREPIVEFVLQACYKYSINCEIRVSATRVPVTPS